MITQDKLVDGSYNNKGPAEVAADIDLVFTNAMLYNEDEDHEVHRSARYLRDQFRHLWAQQDDLPPLKVGRVDAGVLRVLEAARKYFY